MSEEHRDQLGLWATPEDRRREQQITWLRMYDEFQASLNTPPEIHGDHGGELKQLICLRCGTPSYYGTIHINHDLGYCGCPTDVDPTWKNYEKAPGFQAVWDNGEIRSMLTDEEMLDRWDADKLPRCRCGCPFGLHDHGSWCGQCHPDDCDGYEAT